MNKRFARSKITSLQSQSIGPCGSGASFLVLFSSILPIFTETSWEDALSPFASTVTSGISTVNHIIKHCNKILKSQSGKEYGK